MYLNVSKYHYIVWKIIKFKFGDVLMPGIKLFVMLFQIFKSGTQKNQFEEKSCQDQN